jgi:hypothetical protein
MVEELVFEIGKNQSWTVCHKNIKAGDSKLNLI